MSIFRSATKRHQALIDRDVCELRTSVSLTMEDFQCEVMRALWHPFEFLYDAETGTVQVSRLKVITSSIGQKLGHNKAEEFLNRNDVTSMTFDAFFQVIKEELLDKVDITQNDEDVKTSSSHPSTTKKPSVHELLHGLVKTCWTFCRFERTNKANGMTMEHCMILWRLFNFLSECDSYRKPNLPIRLHREEVVLLLREFIDYTGQRNKESVVKDFLEQCDVTKLVSFTEFLNMFERDFADTLSRNDISQGLNHLFDYYVMNVLAREMMWKRGYNVKNWKERWLVLTTTCLKYYVNNTEKVQKGEIVFDNECRVEVPPERPTHKANRFVIHTKKKPYEISAPDAKTKHEWVSAVQVALKCVDGNPNIQKEAAFQRCLERINKKRLAEEEERKRLEDAEHQRKQQEELNEEKRKRLEDEELLKARQNELEEERKRRAEMEDKLLEEQRLREEEQQRLRELEAIKLELERLLDEERQAKKDEEIVRNLQARLLEEEFQKREELERLKQQQEEMLRAEREQKAVLEGDRKEQQRVLQEAKERLEQLERERAAAAAKMQEASEKLLKAEKDRHIMEERVKLYNTKTSVGLNRPVQPRIDPLVSHRGLGAFCHRDFVKVQGEGKGHSSLISDAKSEEIADHTRARTGDDLDKATTNEETSGVASDIVDHPDPSTHVDNKTDTIKQNQEKKEFEDDHVDNAITSNESNAEPQTKNETIEHIDHTKDNEKLEANLDINENDTTDSSDTSRENDPHINSVGNGNGTLIDETKSVTQNLDTNTNSDFKGQTSDDDAYASQTTPVNKDDDNLWTSQYLIEDEDAADQADTALNLDTNTNSDFKERKNEDVANPSETTPVNTDDDNEWTSQYLVEDEGAADQGDTVVKIDTNSDFIEENSEDVANPSETTPVNRDDDNEWTNQYLIED